MYVSEYACVKRSQFSLVLILNAIHRHIFRCSEDDDDYTRYYANPRCK